MRIEQNQKTDANVVMIGAARQENVADTKKDASIVRIEKDRKADRLLEQPTYGKPEKEGNALEKIKEQASNLDATQMKMRCFCIRPYYGKRCKSNGRRWIFPDGYGDSNGSNRDR